MNTITKTLAVAGANLVALGVSAADAAVLAPTFSSATDSSHAQTMTDAQMRALEASHLEVFAPCKWGHAAFDPIEVGAETSSADIQALHAEIAET